MMKDTKIKELYNELLQFNSFVVDEIECYELIEFPNIGTSISFSRDFFNCITIPNGIDHLFEDIESYDAVYDSSHSVWNYIAKYKNGDNISILAWKNDEERIEYKGEDLDINQLCNSKVLSKELTYRIDKSRIGIGIDMRKFRFSSQKSKSNIVNKILSQSADKDLPSVIGKLRTDLCKNDCVPAFIVLNGEETIKAYGRKIGFGIIEKSSGKLLSFSSYLNSDELTQENLNLLDNISKDFYNTYLIAMNNIKMLH